VSDTPVRRASPQPPIGHDRAVRVNEGFKAMQGGEVARSVIVFQALGANAT
jgi:hypothetical protein